MPSPHKPQTLVESTPSVVSMTVQQASALNDLGKTLASKKPWWGEDEETGQTAEKSIIRCVPEADGAWEVTVANAVGVIAVDGLELLIEPKIPLTHAIYLFSRSEQYPRLWAFSLTN